MNEFVEYHHEALVLSPNFLGIVNNPELDQRVDGVSLSVEGIFEREMGRGNPYVDYLEFSGVLPQADEDPRYHVKKNPIMFARDSMRGEVYPIRSFVRLLRKLPLDIYINNKFPQQSPIAVSVGGNTFSICPFNKDDEITAVDPVYPNMFRVGCLYKDTYNLDFSLFGLVPGLLCWDRRSFPGIVRTLEPVTEERGEMGSILVKLSHDPSLVSEDVVGRVPLRDVEDLGKLWGGWYVDKDENKVNLEPERK